MNFLSGIAFLAVAVTAFMSPNAAEASTKASSSKTSATVGHGYKQISTEDLKSLIDSKKPVIVLDARKKLSGGLLPGAKQLPYTADEKEVHKVLGSTAKDAQIIVYCANIDCPVSKYLAENLVALGYTNVYKYPDGIAAWIQKGYSIHPLKN